MEGLVKLAFNLSRGGPEYAEEFRNTIQEEGYVQRKFLT
jgi:hypothetical protein